MFTRETLGLAALLIFALAGCVLIDSWFIEDDYIDPDGEGPEAPIPTFEIAAKNTQIEIDVDAAPAVPIRVEASGGDAEVPPMADVVYAPPRPRPVDPAGWLGRRHFRSPT